MTRNAMASTVFLNSTKIAETPKKTTKIQLHDKSNLSAFKLVDRSFEYNQVNKAELLVLTRVGIPRLTLALQKLKNTSDPANKTVKKLAQWISWIAQRQHLHNLRRLLAWIYRWSSAVEQGPSDCMYNVTQISGPCEQLGEESKSKLRHEYSKALNCHYIFITQKKKKTSQHLIFLLLTSMVRKGQEVKESVE